MNLPLNTLANTHDPVAQARYNMIEQQIRPWNVLDADVLDLLAVVRREDFVPPAYRSMAFMDIEVPLLGNDAEEAVRRGQSMLQPRVEARILQDLQIKPTDRVLEIGAGSGYMAALLAHRAQRVVSLEIHPELAEMARENLRDAGIQNADVRQADGALDGTVGEPILGREAKLAALKGEAASLGIDLADTTWRNFSSKHSGIVQFAMCDASVQSLRNGSDVTTFRQLAAHTDGTVPNSSVYFN